MIDPDFGNEMNFITFEDVPSCMAIQGPTERSVWYNQQGMLILYCMFSPTQGLQLIQFHLLTTLCIHTSFIL